MFPASTFRAWSPTSLSGSGSGTGSRSAETRSTISQEKDDDDDVKSQSKLILDGSDLIRGGSNLIRKEIEKSCDEISGPHYQESGYRVMTVYGSFNVSFVLVKVHKRGN